MNVDDTLIETVPFLNEYFPQSFLFWASKVHFLNLKEVS